ncbi:MAG TPA: transcription elongation factor GreA [Syntrophales bacterium]|nr:transcription elongation factor GreA [Syntrophales bacterium]
MEKMPITKAGFEKLKKELDQLKRVLIPENIKAIEEARAHGDISENAEYQYAKERQSFLHGRQQEIENSLATSQIVELNGLTGERAVFGTTVSFSDVDSGDTTRYQLVGPYESDLSRNRISVTSPIGRALIGKNVGDVVRVKTPGGVREVEIVDIAIEDLE